MIKDWLAEYDPRNEEEILSSLREIMQEITLASLSRTDFFEKAAFYGGTALRIFHGLPRFSEDLDFSLTKPDPDFSLQHYFSAIEEEFLALGMTVSLREKDKTLVSPIDSAFLKTETIWQELILEDIVSQLGVKSNRNVKIKIEVDRKPPLGFSTEEKLLLKPFSFYTKCFTLSSLFAGKVHALLFRKWKNRVKGRDWYDLEWYIRKGVPLDLQHFAARAKDTQDWHEDSITAIQVLDLLHQKIDAVSFPAIKEDVQRFIKDTTTLKTWNAQYFNDLVGLMKFEVQ